MVWSSEAGSLEKNILVVFQKMQNCPKFQKFRYATWNPKADPADFDQNYYDEAEINELVSLWHPNVDIKPSFQTELEKNGVQPRNNEKTEVGNDDVDDSYPDSDSYYDEDYNQEFEDLSLDTESGAVSAGLDMGSLIQARGRRVKRPKKRKNKPKKQSARTDRITGVKFVIQAENYLGISWTDKPYFSKYKVTVKPDPGSLKFLKINKKRNTALVQGLSPANNYWISVSGFQKFMGVWIPATTIKVFTKPLPPQDVRMIDYNTESVTVQWKNPNAHREEVVAVAELVNPPNPKWAEQNVNTNNPENKALESCIIDKIPAGTSFDLQILYKFNGKTSKPFLFRVTKPPEKPRNTVVDGIELVDNGLANINISWSWPEAT